MAVEENKIESHPLSQKFTYWYSGVDDAEIENYGDVLKPLSTLETVRKIYLIFARSRISGTCISTSLDQIRSFLRPLTISSRRASNLSGKMRPTRPEEDGTCGSRKDIQTDYGKIYSSLQSEINSRTLMLLLELRLEQR